MKSHKRRVLGLIAAVIALISGFFLGNEIRQPEQPGATVSSEAVEQFLKTRLSDADGTIQPFAQWHGKILVINFWASWCPPCRDEMPAFARLQAKLQHQQVQFIGISLDSADNVLEFSRLSPVNYPLLVAYSEGSELTRLLGNTRLALPYTVVLDREKRIRLTHLGQITEHDLDKLLQKLTVR